MYSLISQVLTSALLLMLIGSSWLTQGLNFALIVGMVASGLLATALPTTIDLYTTGIMAIIYPIYLLKTYKK